MTTDRASLGDEQLWSRAAEDHDDDAFGQLFERQADSVYAHCFGLTGAWPMVEDLTSLVFLEAWRRHLDVRFCGDSVLSWLLGVANSATRNAQLAALAHSRVAGRNTTKPTTGERWRGRTARAAALHPAGQAPRAPSCPAITETASEPGSLAMDLHWPSLHAGFGAASDGVARVAPGRAPR